MQLTRIEGAILEPVPEHPWESGAVFNPATLQQGDVIHTLYRAVEGDNFSTIGYAQIDRSGKIIERQPQPVLTRTEPFERQGVEDPRLSLLDGTYYVVYTGWDGYYARVALASSRDLKHYTKHGVIIPFAWDKDAMFFPERVNGKIVLMHRIQRAIQLTFFDDMEELLRVDFDFWGQYLTHLEDYTIMHPEFEWEWLKIGGGPPPIKTQDGWLLIYHGVDHHLVYRAGAALLDLEDPCRVIARLPYPILEPDRPYEREGDVPNVVFPTGTALFDDELMVYYGGADKVIAAARGSLSELLAELRKHPV
jgi:predicted GH43/DUF377 family glycosyl hydrolase